MAVHVDVQTVHPRRLAVVRGEVAPGAVASAWGPDRMNEANNAVDRWMAANGRESAGQSWEIYGDPTPDPTDTETTSCTS